MSEIRLIHSTFESRENARQLAGELLDEKLVACVNLGNEVISLYTWKNQRETSEEVPFLAKTDRENLNPAINYIQNSHPYDCPEILVTKVEQANKDYEDWVLDQVN